MKTNFNISESEKNRILNLHKKEIIVEKKEIIKEDRILNLLKEQQEKEVNGLINNASENYDITKWQQIIDKVENTGEDVVTFIKKMQNKESAKKFGKFLKNNFNKVKFKQSGDKMVLFFNKLIGKPTPTPQPTHAFIPKPTPTPYVEDPNDWVFNTEKQKEYLLKNGYTEDSLKSFIGKQSGKMSGYNLIDNIYTAISEVFKATYYEPLTNINELDHRRGYLNMPKTLNQYHDLIKKYGFESINIDDNQEIIKFFGFVGNKYSNSIYNKGSLERYIAKNMGVEYCDLKDVYINQKTKVITWYVKWNKTVMIGQIGFTNNKTDQKSTFTPKDIGRFPLIGSDYSDELNDISIDAFKNYILDPDIIQWEDYEDNESIVDKFEYVRSWFIKDGQPLYKNDNGKVFRISDNREFNDAQLSHVSKAVTVDVENLENAINKNFKGDDHQKQLLTLEKLKKDLRLIKFYG